VSTLVASLLAILLYLAAASWLFVSLPRGAPARPHAKYSTVGLVVVALACHAIVLYQGIITQRGLDFGFFDAGSLVAWMVLLILVVASLTRPVENLLLILLPVAALAIGLDLAIPTERLLSADAPHGQRLHALLSIIAFSLFTIAALQALVLAFADRQLRQKKLLGVLHWLPPLQTMENLLFQFLLAGFLALTLSLVTGLIFIEDIFAQHLVHKTVLGITAWLVFGTLIWGHLRYGWRGATAVKFTLSGFCILLLAYFGTKFVLELILHRV
jgi:ABC-type uncharacterized transport system permease subunit